MEHPTDVLPVVEKGQIVGQLDRGSLMEALSEIKPEGHLLTIKPAESADILLRRLDDTETTQIPTVNNNFEFNALWGRTEILQAQGKLPQVRVWQPQSVTLPLEPQETTSRITAARESEAREELPREISPRTITIVRESAQIKIHAPTAKSSKHESPNDTINEKIEEPPLEVKDAALEDVTVHDINTTTPIKPAWQKSTRPVAESLHRDIERGRLAINTLAALEQPIIACDSAGNEIFHNKAFSALRLVYGQQLDSESLVHRAKDAIAQSALKGSLDIEKATLLPNGVRGYDIFCKAIRDFENPSARAQGYIFWLESTRPSAALYVTDDATVNFSGKTLPDILMAEEARAMAWAMREAGGNQSDAALLLGIPRQTFNYRYRKLLRSTVRSVLTNEVQKAKENESD